MMLNKPDVALVVQWATSRRTTRRAGQLLRVLHVLAWASAHDRADGFFMWWRIQHGLGTEDDDWVPVASPKHIRASIASLGLTLDFRPETERRLIELRERRNVLMHKNSVAGRRYCEATAQPNLLGQRLEVGGEYLSSAVDFIDHLTAALALIPYEGLHDADMHNRQRIVTQVFVRSAPPAGSAIVEKR